MAVAVAVAVAVGCKGHKHDTVPALCVLRAAGRLEAVAGKVSQAKHEADAFKQRMCTSVGDMSTELQKPGALALPQPQHLQLPEVSTGPCSLASVNYQEVLENYDPSWARQWAQEVKQSSTLQAVLAAKQCGDAGNAGTMDSDPVVASSASIASSASASGSRVWSSSSSAPASGRRRSSLTSAE